MSWITVRMDLKDNQARAGRIFLSKFALGAIREGQFLYKSIVQVTNKFFDCYSAFSLYFSILLFQGPPSNLYYPPFLIFTLHVDSRSLMLILVPSAPSLGVVIRLKNTVQRSLPH